MMYLLPVNFYCSSFHYNFSQQKYTTYVYLIKTILNNTPGEVIIIKMYNLVSKRKDLKAGFTINWLNDLDKIFNLSLRQFFPFLNVNNNGRFHWFCGRT